MPIGEILRSFLYALVVWVALLIWWAVCIRINAWLSPAAPIYAVLAFGAPIALRSRVSFSSILPHAAAPDLAWSFVSALLGLGICIFSAFICFSFAEGPAAAATSSEGLTGIAAMTSGILLPAYLAFVEEVSFRGQLQGRLTPLLGKARSIGFATAAFLGMHISNGEFADYWPMYLSVSLVCGMLASNSGILAGAIFAHVSFNIFGAVIAPWMNRSTALLESAIGRVFLFIGLAVAICLFVTLLVKRDQVFSRGKRVLTEHD